MHYFIIFPRRCNQFDEIEIYLVLLIDWLLDVVELRDMDGRLQGQSRELDDERNKIADLNTQLQNLQLSLHEGQKREKSQQWELEVRFRR